MIIVVCAALSSRHSYNKCIPIKYLSPLLIVILSYVKKLGWYIEDIDKSGIMLTNLIVLVGSLSSPEIRPAVGMEEEGRGNINGEQITPTEHGMLVRMMLERTGGSVKDHGYNASRFYVDGPGAEFATGECSSPRELAVHVAANEEMYREAVADMCTIFSKEESVPVTARIHRRTIDAEGSTHASHLNISLSLGQAYDIKASDEYAGFVLGHAATKSVLTGAGLVGPKGDLYYSQKRSVPHNARSGRFYRPTVYEVRKNSNSKGQSVEARFESRDNDINFSDWAVQVNVASTVGMLAIMRSPHLREFPASEVASYWDPSPQNEINRLHLLPDGTIVSTPAVRTSLAVQNRVADIMIDEFWDRLSPDYRLLYREIQLYCRDFGRVLDGEASVSLLADRADWAAKFEFILQRMQQGKVEFLGDIKSQAADMLYDISEVRAQGDERRIVLGQGYRLRQRGKFALSAGAAEVEKAKTTPPSTPRAQARVKYMRSLPDVNHVSWLEVGTVLPGNNLIMQQLPQLDAA